MIPPHQRPPADELYLAAHDGIAGRALLPPPVLGAGLAAALLGELVLGRRITLTGDQLHVADPRPTGDPATTAVLRRLPGPRRLAQAVDDLAAGVATGLIEGRLTGTGVLREEARRRLFSTQVSLVFADPRAPGEPAARLRADLSYNRTLSAPDLLLAGLILATGLDRYVLDTLIAPDRARLTDQFRRHLPQPLNVLIARARSAADRTTVAIS